MATTLPRPTPAELDEAYSTWYRPAGGRFSGLGDVVLRWTRGRLAHRIDRLAPAGDVLDVGAGDGALLDALAARGRRGVGLERSATRDDMRDETLAEVGGQWAAIVFWHSLEHLEDPAAALRQAASMLQAHGLLVVAVPDAASLQARLFGDRWLALDLPRHLVHLHRSALVGRLTELGLSVRRVSSWRGGQVVFGWMHGILASLAGRLDLYDAIRRPEARSRPMSRGLRTATLALVPLSAPIALAGAAVEILAGRGGTVYVEAVRD